MAGRPTTKQAPPFGQRLADLRKERGWTQLELAQRLGMSVKMATYFEREAKNPTHKTIEEFAKVFGIPASELLGEIQVTPKAERKPGPPSQLEERLIAIRQLPRQKQKVVLQFLDSFLQTNSPKATA